MELFSKMYKYEEDYDTIKNWAFKLGTGVPHNDCLPGVGAIIIDKDWNKYGCGFLYLDNETPVSVLEWMLVKPELKSREKIKVIKAILNVLEECSRLEEKYIMFSGSPSNGITKLYEKCGWKPTIRNVTHLIKNIQQGD